MDEILVKGKDGKWYILRGEELLPYDAAEGIGRRAKSKEQVEVPGTSISTPYALRPTPPAHEEHPLRVELEELVDKVMKEVEAKLLPAAQHESLASDPVLKKRFRTIISARLRDVRDALETREMLERPVKIGGLGFITPPAPPLNLRGGTGGVTNADQGMAVLEIIEQAFAEFQAKWKKIEDKRKEEWRKQQLQQREQRQQQEQQEAVRVERAPAPSQPPAPIKPLLAPPPPMVVKKKLPPTLPPKPTPRPAPFSVPQKPQPGKITDVYPAPKLQGPVEELGSLTIRDFRRLAPTPSERIDKILARVDFIGKEGLARRLKAIDALQGSPVMREYRRVVQETFAKGAAPEALLTRGGDETPAGLTAEEFYGIMELNQKLRF